MSHELLPYFTSLDVRQNPHTYFLHHFGLLSEFYASNSVDQKFVTDAGKGGVSTYEALHHARPYWEFTNGRGDFFESFTRGDFQIDISRIGAYTISDFSEYVQATLDSYIAQGTFGDLRIGDIEEYDRLLAVLVGGFDENRIIVRVKDRNSGSLVGGCMVVPGKSERKIGELIGSKEAALPTLSALSFDVGLHPAGRAKERNAVCFSRFFRVPDAYLPNADQKYRVSLSKEILSGMVIGASRFADLRKSPFQYGIVDTHDSTVSETMVKHYAGEVVSRSVLPSDLVKAPHPLHWHYDMPGIVVLAFPFEEMYRLVMGYDQEMGEKLPIPSKGAI